MRFLIINELRGRLTPRAPAALPTKGENIEDIANDYQNIIMPGLTHWQHPSFFAYFPTPATFEGIIGDLYATMALNPSFNVCIPSNWYFLNLTLLGQSGFVAPRALS